MKAILPSLLCVVLLPGCFSGAERSPAAMEAPVEIAEQEAAFDRDESSLGRAGSAAPSAAPAPQRRAMAKNKKTMAKEDAAPGKGAFGAKPADDRVPEEPAPATRAWFPETFVFVPNITTNAEGMAQHEVKVPDRLTTWRVLALAHTKDGLQGGDTTSFLGTLPVYVDLALPDQVMVGDRIEVPVQLVNTTNKAVQGELRFDVAGARLLSPGATIALNPSGSVTRPLVIEALTAGELTVEASFGRSDSVRKSARVVPRGRPVSKTFSGTLGATAKNTWTHPATLDPSAADLIVEVVPGAVGVMASEMSASLDRSSAIAAAYALSLAGRAPGVVRGAEGVFDAKELRRLRILAMQRVLRASRSPSPDQAAFMAAAAAAHPEDPVAEGLNARLIGLVTRSQRPDGTFLGGNGWALNRLMVASAVVVRQLNLAATTEDNQRKVRGAGLRASGAFERWQGRINDPYTAAVIAGSGAVQGQLLEKLREMVRKAVTKSSRGTASLSPTKAARRMDGSRPSSIDATAWAVLALPDGDPLRPALGAELLSGYRGHRGFGDALTNTVSLDAVAAVFSEPPPETVDVALSVDGEVVKTVTLKGQARFHPSSFKLSGVDLAGVKNVSVSSQPQLPGHAIRVTAQTYTLDVPPAPGGMELDIDAPKTFRVGVPARVGVSILAPRRGAAQVDLGLPVGVRPLVSDLEALVKAKTITRFEDRDRTLTVWLPSQRTKVKTSFSFGASAKYAGKLHAAGSLVSIGSQTLYGRPAAWTVSR